MINHFKVFLKLRFINKAIGSADLKQILFVYISDTKMVGGAIEKREIIYLMQAMNRIKRHLNELEAKLEIELLSAEQRTACINYYKHLMSGDIDRVLGEYSKKEVKELLAA